MIRRRDWNRCLVSLLAGFLLVVFPIRGSSATGDERLRLAQEQSFEEFRNQRKNKMEQRRRDFVEYVQERSEAYEEYYQKRKEAFRKFKERIASAWGKDNVDVSTKKTMTEYEEDVSSRYSVDFEDGSATAEVLVPADEANANVNAVNEKLKDQVEKMVTDRTLDDEVARETEGATEGEAETELDESVLSDQVRTEDGEEVDEHNAKEFADKTVKSQKPAREEVTGEDGKKRIKASVTVKLIPEHTRKRAEKYLGTIKQYADRFDLEPELVLALVHTESSFNPKARSHIPAYGLMQLVPASGGKAAYKHLYDQERVLKPSYLYQPDNNVELGSGYMNLLQFTYLDGVDNPTSRMYCAAAAYNTGPGNLAKTFVDEMNVSDAVDVINRMSPDEVYRELRRSLPYDETKKYIKKIRTRHAQYKRWLKERS